jgi:Icc protein
LFADATASLRGTVTHDSLLGVLDHIRSSNWPADLVAMTGDLIQDDSADAYQRFRELLAPLGLPVHCVPGNHDVRGLMKKALSSPPFYYCDTFVRNNWIIVGLDSCVSDSAAGRLEDSELQRLESLLKESSADHALVCLHHPPQELGSRWLDQVGLQNFSQFLRVLAASGKVRGCLAGHAHQEFEGRYENLRILGTPSTCRQFKPGSDEFALDDMPPAYRRVELCADGSIATELVWVSPARAGN